MAEFKPVYADVTPYRQGIGASAISPLEALIQGVQQGQQLQQLPQQLQDQQLERQLRNAMLQQKLLDLQNPEQALARRIQEELTVKGALNPDLGIVRAQPGLVGETIFNPGAITEAQQVALPTVVTPQTVIPTAVAGLPETPIAPFNIQTGLNINPNIPRQAKEDTLNRQITLANSKLRTTSPAIKGQFISDGFGGMIFAQQPTESGGDIKTTRVQTPEGENVKVIPKTGKTGGTAITANQQASLFNKYGKVKDLVGDIDDPKLLDATGNIDYNKLAMEVGNAERIQEVSDLNAKEKQLTAAQKKDNAGFIAAKKDLIGLKSKIISMDSRGQEPGMVQNGWAVVASFPATGFFSSAARQFANSQLTDDTIQKESLRAGLDSAVTKALSGLAVSSQEAQRLTPLIPKQDDTLKIILQKTAALEDFLNNRIEGTGTSNPAPDSIVVPTGAPSKIGRFTIITR